MIEISVESYERILNNWESHISNKKHLDTQLNNYLESCINRDSRRGTKSLNIKLPKEVKDREKEKITRHTFKSHYKSKLKLLKKEALNKVLKIVLLSLFGLIFLILKENTFSNLSPTIKSIINISGWVLIWNAVYSLFISSFNLCRRFYKNKKLQKLNITFSYH